LAGNGRNQTNQHDFWKNFYQVSHLTPHYYR